MNSLTLLGAGTNRAAGGAVTFDAATSAGNYSASSITFSHTVGASANYLLVGVSWFDGGGRSITGVTYNGVSMSSVISQEDTSTGNSFKSHLWKLANPATGANNVVVTFSTTVDDIAAGAASFIGVNATTPLGTAAGASGVSTTATVNVSSATGEMVFDNILFDNRYFPANPAGGQTQRWTQNGSAGNVHGSSSTKAGAGSVTMSWTPTTSSIWVIVAVPVKP